MNLAETQANKLATKTRLRLACVNSGISQIDFVAKYSKDGIPERDGGIPGAYGHIMNMLSPNQRQKVQDWLIDCIEREEKCNCQK